MMRKVKMIKKLNKRTLMNTYNFLDWIMKTKNSQQHQQIECMKYLTTNLNYKEQDNLQL